MERQQENVLMDQYNDIKDQFDRLLIRLQPIDQEPFRKNLDKYLDDLHEAALRYKPNVFDKKRKKCDELLKKIEARVNEVDKVKKIQQQVDETRKVMEDNIDSLLERGEKLEKMADDADRLEKQSEAFKKSSKYAHNFFNQHGALTVGIVGAAASLATMALLMATEAMALLPAAGVGGAMLLLTLIIALAVHYINRRSLHNAMLQL